MLKTNIKVKLKTDKNIKFVIRYEKITIIKV